MSTRRSRAELRAELRAALAIARANALARRPPAEWPRTHALARYVMLARQAAAGLAHRAWRLEMNSLRPVVLGPIPAERRRTLRTPRRPA